MSVKSNRKTASNHEARLGRERRPKSGLSRELTSHAFHTTVSIVKPRSIGARVTDLLRLALHVAQRDQSPWREVWGDPTLARADVVITAREVESAYAKPPVTRVIEQYVLPGGAIYEVDMSEFYEEPKRTRLI